MSGSIPVPAKVGNGHQTKLPRRHVARHRLCLRGTTDYWTNDAQPFFVVERPIDQGLLEVLRNEVVPRLLKDVPRQPTEQELEADPFQHRFVLLFDREGYSPGFLREMWQTHRIACITYPKYPKAPWPASEFADTHVSLPGGETVWMKWAERGSWIGDKKPVPTKVGKGAVGSRDPQTGRQRPSNQPY